jgi:hypothetical protein
MSEARRLLEPMQGWVEHHFWWLFLLAFVWVLLAGLGRGLWRAHKGRPVFVPRAPDALFLETWTTVAASALVPAQSCAWVLLTPAFLQIGWHFPLSVALPAPLERFAGVEAKIPLGSIAAITGPDAGSSVTVSWRDSGAARSTKLTLRSAERFVEKLRAAREAAA